MTVTYQKERFKDVMAELPELFVESYEEYEIDKDIIPFEVDLVRLLETEANGVLHLLTARDDEKLIGYVLIYITTTTHHRNTKMAATDSIHISNAVVNRGIILRRLIEESKKLARDFGAKKLYFRVKAGSSASKLLSAMRLMLDEETYSCLV